ncbi:MAG: permease-like cell division protein FtsX, partial [Alistipes sp.]|nr:permease-like cell division protein FtsX [Alistipes sp.]
MQETKRLKRKVRNSYIISTVSIALVLFLLGSVSYLIFSALDITERMKRDVAVYVMLAEGTTPETREELRRRLMEHEVVSDALFVSKEEAAAQFRAEGGCDFEEFLGFNPLPDSFEVKLSAAGPDLQKMPAFEKAALGWDGVEEGVYQRGVVEN